MKYIIRFFNFIKKLIFGKKTSKNLEALVAEKKKLENEIQEIENEKSDLKSNVDYLNR